MNRVLLMWWKLLVFVLWWVAASCAVLWVYTFVSNFYDDVDDVPLLYTRLKSAPAGQTDLFPNFAPEPVNEFRIALCSKVGDEMPYLLEWIEWHRLQGVDKFALYNPTLTGDPATADSRAVELVQSLYAQRGQRNLIDILPAVDLHPDTNGMLLFKRMITPMQAHRSQQHLMISHCVEKYKDMADWILHIDPDEFVYATTSENSTLWSFLNGDHANLDSRVKLEQLLDPTRTVGYQIEARQMGMAGRMFDFHTSFALDSVAGITDVYFDPRDSLLYKMRSTNSSPRYILDPAHIAQQLFLKGTDRSHVIESELTDKINSVLNGTDDRYSQMLMNQIRISDVINQLTQLRNQPKAISLVAAEWTEAFMSQFPDPGSQPLTVPDSEPIKAFSETVHLLAETAKAKQASYSVVNLSGDSQIGSFLNDTARLEMLEELKTAWMPYFPLITDEQITTGPLHSDWNVGLAQLWEAMFAKCTKESPCTQPPSPGWMTSLGKSIYRTASMKRSHASRTRGTLRGCLRPWVHTCAHDVSEGRLPSVGPKHGIRLDHHQFRSLERRTTRLPSWRGGTAGYADKAEFDAMLRYLSLSPALEKQRLSSVVRRRIFEQFSPTPKLMNFTVIADSVTDMIRAVPTNLHAQCSPTELLREVQVPCPKSHPFVGQRYVGLNSVHYLLPDQYCTDVETVGDATNDDSYWLQTLVQNRNWTSHQAQKHLHLCPGWPESRCCTSTRGDESIWDTDLAVVVSGKYDVWQNGGLPPD